MNMLIESLILVSGKLVLQKRESTSFMADLYILSYFTPRLWFCISEFEEIGSSRFMKKTLIDSLPHFNSIVNINLSYVATDKFL